MPGFSEPARTVSTVTESPPASATAAGFSNTLSIRTTVVRGEAGTSGAATAPTCVTVPMKMISDRFTSAARLIWATAGTPATQARPRGEWLIECAWDPHDDRLSSWQNGDTEKERIDRNGHRRARAIEQPMRREIHPSLIHHTLREVSRIGCVVR